MPITDASAPLRLDSSPGARRRSSPRPSSALASFSVPPSDLLSAFQDCPERLVSVAGVSVIDQTGTGGRMSSIKVGRVIAGKYQLERPLARGGMGSIWVARHLQLETTVAIKFIEPGLGDITEARGRFAREAKAAAQLQGPHLVQIYDYGDEDDTPYVVMERLEGEDLSTRLKPPRPARSGSTCSATRPAKRMVWYRAPLPRGPASSSTGAPRAWSSWCPW